MSETQEMNDGGAAFPQPMATSNEGVMYCSSEKGPEFAGMNLRDYFAAKAIQGIMSSIMRDLDDISTLGVIDGDPEEIKDRDETIGIMASLSYRVADAMLKARGAK